MITDNESTVILIVDDDDLVLKTLNVLISALGYQCLLAGDGLEAVEVLKEKRCDLILTDVLMPNMDGLELLAYVSENFPKIDVIVATGFSERASYADVIKAGAIDFIKKPIDQAELEAKLARAMRERKMVSELEQLSLSDSLTSIYNRRAFDKYFVHEVERAFRQDYQLFLAILDIDNFKEYNDKLGHPEGDKVLVSLGEILVECTRQNVDMAFRLGGDEFAVLLPQTSANQATEIVQRILLRFIEANYGKTTLSIGIVSCDRNPELELEVDIVRMKARADKTMYEAKSNGKSCVICRL
ncbi:GGDEF domain-containing response regulator [Desulfopila inferna]|uniref:GGDEF domain-containing response regulator n=1 Tax=Desulfopila inferna TaxID=468528 RepID=UPI00196364D0|nr:diguanylate cyclase [Desulfopila inferna]MBM9604203.1 diguanylate cyclase [Desulfopila inferna]